MDGSSAKLNKKIRDIQRLLKRPLDAKKRVENERLLETLKSDLVQVKSNQKAKHTAQKYHMVRFFEKQKAVRRLRQAVKVYNKSSGKKSAAKALSKCEIDFYYVVLFPRHEKYISLFAEDEVKSDSKDISGLKRKHFKDSIKTMIANGSLPVGVDSEGHTKVDLKAHSDLKTSEEGHDVKDLGEPEQDEEDNFFE